MLKITMTIGGKEINNSHDVKDAVNKMMITAIEKNIRQRLSHMGSQLEQTEISFDMNTSKIQISNIPDGMKEKITEALSN